MIPYVIILSLSFLLTGLDFFRLRKKDNIWFFIAIIAILVLLSGLRPAGIDRDYAAYRTAYGYMQYLSWHDILGAYATYQLELGYVFLTKLFYSLGFSFGGFLFIYEFVLGTLLAFLIYKYSPYPFTTLCLYISLFYFLRNFTQIRFAFSAVLLLYGLFKFSEKKIIRGILFITLAGLLHNAAWIGLCVPLCYYTFYNRWLYIIFPPIGYIISFFHPIKIIFSLVGLPKQLTRYFHTTMNIGVGLMSYFFSYILLVLAVFHYQKLKELFGVKFEYLYISLALAVFIGLMFVDFPIMQRVSGALFTTSIFFVAYIIKMLTEREWYGYREVFAMGVVLIFLFYGFKLILISHILRPYF